MRHELPGVVVPADAGMVRPRGSPGRPRLGGPRPTRRWFDRLEDVVPGPNVVPADAGVVRRAGCCRAWPVSGPRRRGGGSWEPEHIEVLGPWSPPTRGWFAEAAASVLARVVVPADAGVVRTPCCTARVRPGGPRRRGGGSPRTWERTFVCAWPPPTRGWFETASIAADGDTVVPADAGVVRRTRRGRRWPGRGPRRRGGGSYLENSMNSGAVWSPPTQGWFGVDPAVGVRGRVVPADAGVVLPGCPGHRTRRSGPRRRGGGSPWEAYADAPDLWSPPTRGWFAWRTLLEESGAVVPADAGVVRTYGSSKPLGHCGPRRRGGGSAAPGLPGRSVPWSPPTRGWFVVALVGVRAVGVVPANAGVVRCRGGPGAAVAGGPRRRGGGSNVRRAVLTCGGWSAPTRGSSYDGQPSHERLTWSLPA